jgi:hypothetical protein
MKWLMFAGLAIAALIIMVVLIGLLLPKTHRATRMARFRQPPETIFAAITGPQDWRPGVTCEELPAENGRRRWREKTSQGAITFEEDTCEPPRLYRSRIADKNLPFSGTWTWEITPTDDGCTCRITEDGEVYNPVFRFVGQLIIGHTRTIEVYLQALGKKCGEAVKVEA